MNGPTSFRHTRHMYPKQSMDIHVCSRTRTTSTAYSCRQTYMWLVFYGPQKLRAQLRSFPTSKRKQEPLQVSPQEEKGRPTTKFIQIHPYITVHNHIEAWPCISSAVHSKIIPSPSANLYDPWSLPSIYIILPESSEWIIPSCKKYACI